MGKFCDHERWLLVSNARDLSHLFTLPDDALDALLLIMPDTKLLLRILYTINSSPQYILARSYAPVPVVLIPPEQGQADASPIYGTASLKTCLTTICRSSPELVQDNSRDFSVYVLDPLESNSAPAPVHISDMKSGTHGSSSQEPSIANQPRGVAVGLGLMSWALSADESDAVTAAGTLYKSSAGQEALEVIFALRGVRSFFYH